MNEENIMTELEELLEQSLIKEYKIIKADINIIQFRILTLENKYLELETTTNYCYKLAADNTVYESFEQLLSKNSGLYNQKFSSILVGKLSALSNMQEDQDN